MSKLFFRLWQHLLPSGSAWTLTINKNIRRLFDGLSFGGEFKAFIDNIFDDKFPEKTRDIVAWEAQFGPPESLMTLQQRRDRLGRLWARKGSQDPSSLLAAIHAEGFVDVDVTEWWGGDAFVPPVGVIVCPTPLDPTAIGPSTYCISNKIAITTGINDIVSRAGVPFMVAGNINAVAGRTVGASEAISPCIIPTDPNCWHYLFYIHGLAGFGTEASIPLSRRDEFENLIIRLRPAQQWLIITANYT